MNNFLSIFCPYSVFYAFITFSVFYFGFQEIKSKLQNKLSCKLCRILRMWWRRRDVGMYTILYNSAVVFYIYNFSKHTFISNLLIKYTLLLKRIDVFLFFMFFKNRIFYLGPLLHHYAIRFIDSERIYSNYCLWDSTKQRFIGNVA